MINVFCVYVGNLYTIDYVENLYHGVKNNLDEEFTFYIFTDRKDQVKKLEEFGKIVLLPKLEVPKNWWYKIYMFNKENAITGPVLYLDLDVIIIGKLDPLVSRDGKFRIIHDFNRSNVGSHYNKSNSSVMSWDFAQFTYIWARFKENMPKYVTKLAGDQDYIHLTLRDKEWWPDNWIVSYKWEYKRDKMYDQYQTKVMVFHGKPKPHEITDVALKEIWQYNT